MKKTGVSLAIGLSCLLLIGNRGGLQLPIGFLDRQAEDMRTARPQVNLSESLGFVPGIVVQNREGFLEIQKKWV